MWILLAALAIHVNGAANLACLSRDGVQFVTYAKRLAVEPLAVMRDTTKQPGYPALMLAVNRITINSFYKDHPIIWQGCGQFVAICGGAAACLLIYFLGRRLFGDTRIALVAGLMACAWPQGAMLGADVLSDMPHLALFLAAMVIGLSAMDRMSLPRFAACGAVAGLAYLVRQEALGLVTAMAICALWPSATERWARRVAGVACMAGAFAVIAAPHSIATGRVMPNKSLDELMFGREAAAVRSSTGDTHETGRPEIDATTSTRAATLRQSAVFAHQVAWYMAPARMVEEWCKSGRYVLSTLALIALILKTAPRPESRGTRLVVVAIALQLVAVQLRVKSYGEISSRYLLIPAALTIPWAAAGMSALVTMIAAALARGAGQTEADPTILARRRIRSLWLSASLVVFVPLVYYATMQINADKAPYKLAGWWLRSNTKRADRVHAHDRLEQVMFYAGRTWPETTWIHGDDGRTEPSLDRLDGIIRETMPDYVVDARRSRDGDKAAQDAYFEQLSSGDSDSLEVIWKSGAANHEVIVMRERQAAEAAEAPKDKPTSE